MTKDILFKNREDWRVWLADNHTNFKEVWLIYYKKHTNKQSVKQSEAVEEALCYGWIDSIVKRIDDEQFKQKFTPRRDDSIWSDLNKKRVAQLFKDEKMTKFGLKKINIAKKNGMWNKIQNQTNIDNIPHELKIAIANNKILNDKWIKLAPSRRKQFLYWINDAKRNETKLRRIEKTINLIINNNLGLI